jgi:hypothetical protein
MNLQTSRQCGGVKNLDGWNLPCQRPRTRLPTLNGWVHNIQSMFCEQNLFRNLELFQAVSTMGNELAEPHSVGRAATSPAATRLGSLI